LLAIPARVAAAHPNNPAIATLKHELESVPIQLADDGL